MRCRPARPAWAELALPPRLRRGRSSRAKRLGIAYERAVGRALSDEWALGVWFRFGDSDGVHWCQPDGLHLDFRRGVVTILEIKLRHTPRAWWQLRELYLPVVSRALGRAWSYRLVELCKWYDPDTHFPGEQKLIPALLSPIPPNAVGVHIWHDSRGGELRERA